MSAPETEVDVTHDGQSGQAATEYALLVFWTVGIILTSVQALNTAILNCFQDIASVICLPIP
jgi:Flp pilus assembly pilin Flp